MQRRRDAHQPPGRDAVRAFLVFLQQLERDADRAREIALRQSSRNARGFCPIATSSAVARRLGSGLFSFMCAKLAYTSKVQFYIIDCFGITL